MKKFATWLKAAGLADESNTQGLSEDVITGIEAARCISLPLDYKDFLRQCGCSAGMFGRDIEILHPNFLFLNKEFLEIAEEFGIPFVPPASAFFFSAYQGGSFHYFTCEGDDANVYVLNEGDCAPTVVAPSFTSFMINAISSYQDALTSDNCDKSWIP